MLRITIPEMEFWDERKEEFRYTKEQTLQLEHSLVSLSKWESKFCKPFLSKQEKTLEETIYYVKCMTLTQNVNPDVYNRLTDANIEEINRYIEAPMTATRFSDERNGRPGREQITAELIYYWMIALNIPPIPFLPEFIFPSSLTSLMYAMHPRSMRTVSSSRRRIWINGQSLSPAIV